MKATVCESCLTKVGVLIVCLDGERCRRCGHTPERGVLTPREIRACLLGREPHQ